MDFLWRALNLIQVLRDSVSVGSVSICWRHNLPPGGGLFSSPELQMQNNQDMWDIVMWRTTVTLWRVLEQWTLLGCMRNDVIPEQHTNCHTDVDDSTSYGSVRFGAAPNLCCERLRTEPKRSVDVQLPCRKDGTMMGFSFLSRFIFWTSLSVVDHPIIFPSSVFDCLERFRRGNMSSHWLWQIHTWFKRTCRLISAVTKPELSTRYCEMEQPH